MSEFDFREFNIGELVWVTGRVRKLDKIAGVGRYARVPEVVPAKKQMGVIVGVGKFNIGETIRNGEYNEFKTTGILFFWLVRLGIMNKPIMVAREDLVRLEVDAKMDVAPSELLPISYQEQPRWSEADRKVQSEEDKSWPRDENGRWKKVNQ